MNSFPISSMLGKLLSLVAAFDCAPYGMDVGPRARSAGKGDSLICTTPSEFVVMGYGTEVPVGAVMVVSIGRAFGSVSSSKWEVMLESERCLPGYEPRDLAARTSASSRRVESLGTVERKPMRGGSEDGWVKLP